MILEYFFSCDEKANKFAGKIKGFGVSVERLVSGTEFSVLLTPKTVFKSDYIPTLSRDELMFDKYSKAIRLLTSNLGESEVEDSILSDMIIGLKVLRTRMEDR